MVTGIEHPTNDLLRNAMEKARASAPSDARKVKEGLQGRGEDTVHLGKGAPRDVTYTRPAADLAQSEGNFALLRDLVARLLTEQGATFQISLGGSELGIRDLTPEQAVELIAEDGYFGVEKTSQRIFDLAVAVAGNDPSKIDQIRKGVEDGFREAAKAFGGILPEISWQTRAAVMDKLQAWEEGVRG